MPNRICSLAIALFLCMASQGQVIPQSTLQRTNEKPTELKVLHSDTNVSSYCIWVSDHVAAHRHNHHTEHVYVIEGEGTMLLGEEEIEIKPGDIIVIPVKTVHAVRTSSDTPLKVISIQAPQFKGDDREFIDVEGW